MIRAMYTAISGLKAHQIKLDVIGNNIANVNTVGFKKSQTSFQEVFSQTTSGASGPQGGKGGTNPQQVGLGVSVGSIRVNHEPGSPQRTDYPLDFYIGGDGYFTVSGHPTFANKSYTRAGNFDLDADGILVTSQGLKVLGYKGAVTTKDTPGVPGEIKIVKSLYDSFSVNNSGEVVGIKKSDGSTEVIATLALTKFNNPGGLSKEGSNLFSESRNSGKPVLGAPGGTGYGDILVGTIEMSNVDLANEFTDMITAQRGFQANSRVITTSDEILQELVNLKR